ncbi:flagellar motor stator protein MotA [Paenibacillus tyrfis]|uniref:Flagellar motor protein MotA n=1 Tax=Paenibacillus tyrfis TaxID=1501230 RepID=A0A081P7U5_9BACL|nr:flagellar motor stator protein MotA [Paenibacillus tyrfis]KEQ26768.1 flagellar motor protein MotA [Paenibacillus tyrfis]
MEKSTIIGIILAIIAVGVGMVLKGASLSALLNPAAILIIFVGTAAALFIGFSLEELKLFPKLMKIVFTEQKTISKLELIDMFTEWVAITRREGLLAMESKVEEIPDPFLRNGMRMIIDGNDQEFVHDVLMEDIHTMQERHRTGAQIFTQAGTYAPTLGVLGAVVGLIAALSNLSEIEALGHLISAAFVATLLGIFSGYVLWHPIANKLKQKSKKEVELRMMMVEGLLSIQTGISATAVQQKLMIFVPTSQREKNNDTAVKADE